LHVQIIAPIALVTHFPVLLSEGDFSFFTVDGNISLQHWPRYFLLEDNSLYYRRRISQPFHIGAPLYMVYKPIVQLGVPA
jgi:hypothetical protein